MEMSSMRSWIILYLIASRTISYEELRRQTSSSMNQCQSMYYKQQNFQKWCLILLDSHDTERILWTANEDVQLVKSALAFLFLQKGTSCIYYGTELSLTGGPDPDCRRCMPWERVSNDNDMLNFMKKLINIRNKRQQPFSMASITSKNSNQI